MSEFKLIVAGSRDFNNYVLLSKELHDLANGIYKDRAISIVSGMARGADKLAYDFAKENGVQCYEFVPDWNGPLGKGAGFARNTDMAKFSDGLLAFWDGSSKGTAHMIRTMTNMGKAVRVVKYATARP